MIMNSTKSNSTKSRYTPRRPQQPSLQLAVDTLPFYLSHADYTLELANYFLSHNPDLKALNDLFSNMQPLQEAIDIYLKVHLVLNGSIIFLILWLNRDGHVLKNLDSETKRWSCQESVGDNKD